MDKSWMKAYRAGDEYINGVERFLDFAFTNSKRKDNKIPCPCMKCNNVYCQTRDDVKFHLVTKGMVPLYTTWHYHGEEFGGNAMNIEESDVISNDCASSSTPRNTTGSTSTRKRTRGKTRNLRLCGLTQKLKLDFNQYDQPIGQNASKLTSEIGVIIRAPTGDAPISSIKWENIPEEKREKMYQRILEIFEFEDSPCKKLRIMQMFKKKFKDHKHKMKVDYYDKFETDEERLLNVPEGVNKDDWKVFCDHLGTPEYQEMSARNKKNRSKQTLVHTTGTRSYAVIRAAEAEKDPDHCEPSQWRMFQITHAKKDGSMASAAAEHIMDEFQTLSSQLSDSPAPMREDNIFKQIMGPERHGRVRGYGLGPTPTFVFGSSSSRLEILNMSKTTNKKNEMMQSQLEELRKEIEEERRRNEENRRRTEDELKKFEKKNDEVLKKMEKKLDELRVLVEEKMSSSSGGSN